MLWLVVPFVKDWYGVQCLVVVHLFYGNTCNCPAIITYIIFERRIMMIEKLVDNI